MKKLLLIFTVFSSMACQPRLEHQPKLKTYSSTSFYPNQSAARPVPEDTVPFHLATYNPPTKSSRDLLHEGQKNYVIFCSVCHGLDGRGNGMAVLRGFPQPPSFLLNSLKIKSLQQLVGIAKNGTGDMKGFKDRIDDADLWAIALYIRALQVAQTPEVPQ